MAGIAGVALLLAACGTPNAPNIEPVIVKVPVVAKCDVPMPTEPQYFDSAPNVRAAQGADELAALYVAGRKQRIRYAAELTAALIACKN